MNETSNNPSVDTIVYPEWAINFGLFWCCAVIIIGVTGNITTSLSIIHDKRLRNSSTAKFLLSLCFTDLLFCVVCLPITASRYAHRSWTLGDTLCIIFPLAFYWNVAASLFTMCAVTINRLVLVVWPARYKTVFNSRNIVLMITVCWLFPFLLLLGPLTEYWGRFGYVQRSFSCTILKDSFGRSPKKFFFLLGFTLPCTIMVLSYWWIFRTVRSSKQALRAHTGPLVITRRASSEERAITRAMLLIFCVFLMCYLPLLIANVLDDADSLPTLHVFASALAWSASATNPFIYCLLSDRYRRAVKALFARRPISTTLRHQSVVVSSITPPANI